MNEVVQALETQKLVTRRPDPSHGRIVQLTLTARGTETLRKCDGAVRALERAMLADLSEEARETLRSSLALCVEVLERRDEGPQIRRRESVAVFR
jgi:DNA-binding MarR family transcriptional regulator